jgi:hypothetical protein
MKGLLLHLHKIAELEPWWTIAIAAAVAAAAAAAVVVVASLPLPPPLPVQHHRQLAL